MSHSPLAALALSLAPVLALCVPSVSQVRTQFSIDEGFQFPSPAFAYDEVRSRVIFALPTGQICEWDGSNWAIALPSLPGQPLAAVYDPVRRRSFFSVLGATAARLVEYDGITVIDHGAIPLFATELTADTARGRLIAIGIDTASTAGVVEWDGAGWIQPALPARPSAQIVQCAAYDENRNVTVAMLTNPAQASETWEWNGTVWALRRTEGVLQFGRFAYDPVRRKVVTAEFAVTQSGARAWNGTFWTTYTSQVQGDVAIGLATDRVNGVVWRLGNATTGLPLGRTNATGWIDVASRMHAGHGMVSPRTVYHEARSQLVVFDGPSGRTATWDGFRWSESSSPTAPSQRDQFAMVYDATRGKVVLFGGFDTLTGQAFGDTWTWDGVWQQVATSGPPPQFQSLMADDRGRGRVVLLGGFFSSTGVFERWEWDGVTWRRSGAVPPVNLGALAFGYDEARQRLVFDSGLGMYEEVGGQWQPGGQSSNGAQNLVLVWNVARQRLQMVSGIGALEEYDGSTWQTVGVESGQLAYDRARNVLLAFAITELAGWTDAPAAAFDLGRGCGSATTLAPFGLPRLGNAGFHVDLRATGGQQFAGLVLGLALGNQPLGGGCTYFVQQEVASIVALTNGAGFLQQPLPLPTQPAFLGLAVTLQGGVLDASSPIGVALSPGLRLVLGS